MVAVCVVCALLLVLSGLIDWQVDSTGTSGDIAKSSRFSRKTADTEVSNMQELLAGDEEYRNKIVLAYTVMQTRAEQFYMLVDMSIEAAGNIKEYDAVIADMKAAVPMVKNVCSSMDAAGEDLNAALGGETRKDLAQNINNAALAYSTLQKQNELADRFITITDEYVKKSSASAKLKFARDGMIPVSLDRNVVTDANAIELYGQKAYENNQEALESVGLLRQPLPEIAFGQVYDSIVPYNVLKEMKFGGAYPDITGFTDRNAWNNVTPVLGYRLTFSDPVGLSSIKLGVGMSPWSSNEWKNRFHVDAQWKYYFWTFTAAWNHTDFYDLAGPMRTSRKGYKFSVAYDHTNSMIAPYTRDWGFSVGAYGDMDALPLYQEISLDENVNSMQTVSAYASISKLRGSLGSVMKEQGYVLGLDGYGYLAGGKFYPSVEATADLGVLLPLVRNTSFWLRSAAGHSFGDEKSAFGNSYFGGFRNNRVDYRDFYQYRKINAMPGADIDDIQAHSFVKSTAELNLKPLRFNDFGALFLYPTWTQCSLFGTALSVWNSGKQEMFYSTGIQLSTELVLFNYLKTTFSVGYGHLFAPSGFSLDGRKGNELMVSLKLL